MCEIQSADAVIVGAIAMSLCHDAGVPKTTGLECAKCARAYNTLPNHRSLAAGDRPLYFLARGTMSEVGASMSSPLVTARASESSAPASPATSSAAGVPRPIITQPKKANPLVDLIETEKGYVDLLTGIIRVRPPSRQAR